MNSFGTRLKKYREDLSTQRGQKVGQIALAKELGVAKGYIGDLEINSRKPSKNLLIKLVEHSGKSLNYWMNGVESYDASNSIDLVIDYMIEKGVITDTNISSEAWDIIKDSVLLEVERKLSR
ncbi:MAG: helix-turn-helix domain-containing protein [Clostridium sp.]